MSFSERPDDPPQLVDDGFEYTPLGTAADGVTTWGETTAAKIRVTDEQAASGRRSLKFQDDAKEHAHIYYSPHVRDGLVKLSYDLRLQKGATLWNESRDSDDPYHVGASLVIDGHGALRANDRKVAELPNDTWINIEVTAASALRQRQPTIWPL